MEINVLLTFFGIIFAPGLTFAIILYLMGHPLLALLALVCTKGRLWLKMKATCKSPDCKK